MDYFFHLNHHALSLAQIHPGYVLAVSIDNRYCYEAEVLLDPFSKEPCLSLLSPQDSRHSSSSHHHTHHHHQAHVHHAHHQDGNKEAVKFRCFSDYFQFINKHESRAQLIPIIFTDLFYKYSKDEHMITYRPIHQALSSFRKNLSLVNDIEVYSGLMGLFSTNTKEYGHLYGAYHGTLHILNDIDYYALKEEEYDINTCPFSLGTLKDFCYYMKVSAWGNHQKLEYWLRNYFTHFVNTRMFTPLPAGEQISSYFLGEHDKHACFSSNIQFIHWKWQKDQITFPPQDNISLAFMSSTDYHYFHHGTSSDDMWDIVKNGIDLQRAAAEQDFSHGKGFYCFVDHFESAFDWARSKSGFLPPAILTFAIPKVVLASLKTLRLDPTEGEDWDQVVKGYRLGMYHGEGEDDTEEARTFNRLEEEDYDCIVGPMSSNPDLLFHESPRCDDVSIRQICFKSYAAIELLQQHLVCIYKVTL